MKKTRKNKNNNKNKNKLLLRHRINQCTYKANNYKKIYGNLRNDKKMLMSM